MSQLASPGLAGEDIVGVVQHPLGCDTKAPMGEAASHVNGPLAQLRAATRIQHQALDHMLSAAPPGWSRARYAALLRGSLAVVEPLSAAIARFLPHWADPRRVAALEADLMCLGERPAREDMVLPDIRAAEQAFGCAYVIEGS
ncbi:MAG TPA: biliverdin-producing heme oxygenase, partial [Polyangiales bacterium]